jgi:hypothetical protein
MTLENRQKRYAAYIERNDTEKAEELAAKYPDVIGKEVKKEKSLK